MEGLETKMARVLGGLGPDAVGRFIRNVNRYSDAHQRTLDMAEYIRGTVIPQTLEGREGVENLSHPGNWTSQRYDADTGELSIVATPHPALMGPHPRWSPQDDAFVAWLDRHAPADVDELLKLYVTVTGQPVPDEGLYRLHKRVSTCGSYLLFRKFMPADDTPDIRLKAANFCDAHLLCPFCAIRRSARASQQLAQKLALVLADDPSLKPVMITLTVKNGHDLVERFGHLERSWKKYNARRRQYVKRGSGQCELVNCKGMIYAFELTRSKEHGWHPHVHILALVDQWIDRKALSDEWRGITGDSFIVDVRRVYHDKSRPMGGEAGEIFDSLPDRESPNDVPIIAACCEVMKYALKFDSLTIPENWHAYEVLKGRRLRGSLGALRGVKIETGDLADDLLDDEIPFIDYLFTWIGGHYAINENPTKKE